MDGAKLIWGLCGACAVFVLVFLAVMLSTAQAPSTALDYPTRTPVITNDTLARGDGTTMTFDDACTDMARLFLVHGISTDATIHADMRTQHCVWIGAEQYAYQP